MENIIKLFQKNSEEEKAKIQLCRDLFNLYCKQTKNMSDEAFTHAFRNVVTHMSRSGIKTADAKDIASTLLRSSVEHFLEIQFGKDER